MVLIAVIKLPAKSMTFIGTAGPGNSSIRNSNVYNNKVIMFSESRALCDVVTNATAITTARFHIQVTMAYEVRPCDQTKFYKSRCLILTSFYSFTCGSVELSSSFS